MAEEFPQHVHCLGTRGVRGNLLNTIRTIVAIGITIFLVTVTASGQTPAQEYRLGPDDVISIVLWDYGDLVPRPEAQYTLGPGDSLEVNVWPQTDFSRTVIVRPDGRISLPPAGDLVVTGLTPASLASKVSDIFKRYLKNAQITVIVTKEKLPRTNPISVFGHTRTAIVRLDGKIDLPVVGQLDVNGQTPAQVADRITRGLEQYVRDPKVSVIVQEFKGKRVSVLGQVEKPGQYKLREDAGLAEAIAMAGGPTFAARLQRVVILRGRPESLHVITVNLERILGGQDPIPSLSLEPGDVIIVPGTIADALQDLGKKVPHIDIQIRMQGQGP